MNVTVPEKSEQTEYVKTQSGLSWGNFYYQQTKKTLCQHFQNLWKVSTYLVALDLLVSPITLIAADVLMFHYLFFYDCWGFKDWSSSFRDLMYCYQSWAELFILKEYKSEALLNDHSVDKSYFRQNFLNTLDLHSFKVRNSDHLNHLWFSNQESILLDTFGGRWL